MVGQRGLDVDDQQALDAPALGTLALGTLQLREVRQPLLRNIISIAPSQDLFDDLSSNPSDWALAQQVEDAAKPAPYQSATPVIHRPFEDATWFSAIGWPYQHWQRSRFSDGSFGVWYGCDSVETSVYETAYHWYNGLLRDAGFERERVLTQRKVYTVQCDATLVDLRPLAHTPENAQPSALLHKSDYRYTQSIGAKLQREGHAGLITLSARHASGHNYAILTPQVLSKPQLHCQLTYHLDGERIRVEKHGQRQSGKASTRAGKVAWMEIATGEL